MSPTRPLGGLPRLGTVPSEKSVFLNHPYDERYGPLADALFFAVVCCGFVPRSALETGAVAVPRMERIVGALFASRYSIHDLSRPARFNMPLELGIAMARRFITVHRPDQHDWLLLVSGGGRIRRAVSDLAGFDPESHDQTAETLVPKVIAWLANRTPLRTPTPQAVLAQLPAFQAEKRRLVAEWKGAVPWRHLLVAAEEVARAALTPGPPPAPLPASHPTGRERGERQLHPRPADLTRLRR